MRSVASLLARRARGSPSGRTPGWRIPGEPIAVRAGMDPRSECSAKSGGISGGDYLALQPGRRGRVLRRYRVLLRRLGCAGAGRADRYQPLPVVHADGRIRLLLHYRTVAADRREDPRLEVPRNPMG